MENTNEQQAQLTHEQAVEAMMGGYAVTYGGKSFLVYHSNGKEYIWTESGSLAILRGFINDEMEREDWRTLIFSSEKTILFIKSLRVIVDELNYIAGAYLKPNRETSLVKTELQYAFMWMGVLLSEVGDANPYPNSFDPSNPSIEKYADSSDDHTGIIDLLSKLDYTGKVKDIRVRVKNCIDAIEFIFHRTIYLDAPLKQRFNFTPIHTGAEINKHLQHVNFWLGMELNNIRIAQEAEAKKSEEVQHKAD